MQFPQEVLTVNIKLFKVIIFKALLLLPLSALCTEGQPKVPLMKPADLLNWCIENDADIKFNVSTVPLADRFHIGGLKANSNARANEARVQDCSGMAISAGNISCQGDTSAHRYVFHHWQYIDEFVNFGGSAGEGIILAPSADVTDAAHRNGVRSLGNFFFPPQAYGGNWAWVEDFLIKNPDGSFPTADKLIEMAEFCSFDGWFINQETSYDSAESGTGVGPALTRSQAGVLMREWMEYVKENSELRLCYYDAMQESGSIFWQGNLTDSNDWFFQHNGKLVGDNMFLDFRNYTSANIDNSRSKALSLGRDPYDLYKGLNTESSGYETYWNWDYVFPDGAPHKLSVAIYKANWCYKKASDVEDYYDRSDIYWSGWNRDPSNTETTNSWKGFAHYVASMSVINDLPFVTNFNTGHGFRYFIDAEQLSERQWSNRSVQDIPPSWQWRIESSSIKLTPEYDWNDAYYGGTSLKFSGNLVSDNVVKLYMTDLPVSSDTQLQVVFKCSTPGESHLKIGLTFNDDLDSPVYFDAADATGNWDTQGFSLENYAGKRINMISLLFDASQSVINYGMNIGRISVKDTGLGGITQAPSDIEVLEVFEGDSSDNFSLRMKWSHAYGDIRCYNIYREYADGSRDYLGSTGHNYYFIANAPNKPIDNSTFLVVQTVSFDYSTAETKMPLPVLKTPLRSLLPNGDAENGFTDFSRSSPERVDSVTEDNTTPGGMRCFKLVSGSGDGEYAQMRSPKYPLALGTDSIRLYWNCKILSGSTGQLWFMLRFFTGTTFHSQNIYQLSYTDGQWQTARPEDVAVPAGVDMFDFVVSAHGFSSDFVGTCYVDDIGIYDVLPVNLELIALYWLTGGEPGCPGDMNYDCHVDYVDFGLYSGI
jgi:endo-beta-N-acetylglucosaminidase D